MTNPQDPYNSGQGGNPGDGYTPYDGGANGPGETGGGYPNYPGGSQSGQQPGYGGYQSSYGDQPGYGGYQPGGWGETEEKNGFAPWALGISILAMVLMVTLLLALLAPLAGLVGLILGIVAVVKARKITGRGRRMGMSITAIVLSVITIIVPIAFAIFSFVMLEATGMSDCLLLTNPTEQQACFEDVMSDLETQ